MELCIDMLYSVEDEKDTVKERGCKKGHGTTGGRTGLIVWSDPWVQSNWEVNEGFARKYRKLFEGYDALIESTNHWRRLWGERPLFL